MKTIKIDYPKTAADAIRSVCYLRAWTVRQLGEAMGLKDGSNLSKILNHKEPGTSGMIERILAHMPEKYRKNMETKP